VGVLPIETESSELGAAEICPEALDTSGVVDPLLVFSPYNIEQEDSTE
jgi:hypothetical protein